MSQMQLSITSELQSLKDELLSARDRIGACETRIYDHERAMYGSGPINYKLQELTQSIERLGEQLIKANANINALQIALQTLEAECNIKNSQLRPETNATPVELKEKSDLEIFEPNIDDNIKHYIDLDLITEPNYRIGIFDDDNWFNLQ